MPQKIPEAVKGCIEIILFLKTSVERFENTKKNAVASFGIPVFFLLIESAIAPINADFENYSYTEILVRFLAVTAISLLLYLPTLYFISQSLNRSQYFPRFVVIRNWMALNEFILMIPVWGGVMGGRWTWEEVHPFLLFLSMAGYAYTAFTITHTFRINWMLAASLAILGMACDEFSGFLTYDLVLGER